MYSAMDSFLVICVTSLLFFHSVAENVTVDYFLKVINSRQSAWRAGKYFRGNTTIKTLTHSYKRIVYHKEPEIVTKSCNLEDVLLPESFDARTQWPECSEIIGKIGNQGTCESCWAFAATSVMSDRLCIQTGGKVKVHFSPEDLISCCHYCNSGCAIGKPSKAWEYYTQFGIVSGGGFSSFQGCKPYQESEYIYNKSSTCTETCYNPSYDTSYADDKHFGSHYYFVDKTPECIQMEIMENGPVQAIMGQYEDFPFYKDGVYFYTIGKRKTSHSVKILGWGVERGMPYWLAANSWGCGWGNLNGLFKIKRGVDECAIEQYVLAGNPNVNSSVKTNKSSLKSSHKSSSSRSILVPVILLTSLCVVLIVILTLSVFFQDKIKSLAIKYFRFR